MTIAEPTSPTVRSAAETRRDVAAAYRRKTGRERPVRWSDEACAAWRTAHREAGLEGAWTYTPVASAAALLTTLDALGGQSNGAALARAAGVSQGHATSVSLPRFHRLGLVDRVRGDEVAGTLGRTGNPTRWVITPKGRELARVLRRGEIR